MGRTSTVRKSRSRDAATKVAEHRLSVLELARELGNVAEACRRRGMDRTSFYEWKRRFQTHGFEGLKDLPPIHKSHPQTTPPETVEKIKALALEHPSWGCNRLEALLRLEGIGVSSVTIQKILNDAGLGTRYDRWLALEAWMLERMKAPFTLRGLVAELAERGLKVDYRTVWAFVHRCGYSFKKNRARQ